MQELSKNGALFVTFTDPTPVRQVHPRRIFVPFEPNGQGTSTHAPEKYGAFKGAYEMFPA